MRIPQQPFISNLIHSMLTLHLHDLHFRPKKISAYPVDDVNLSDLQQLYPKAEAITELSGNDRLYDLLVLDLTLLDSDEVSDPKQDILFEEYNPLEDKLRMQKELDDLANLEFRQFEDNREYNKMMFEEHHFEYEKEMEKLQFAENLGV